ncbi:MAG: endonuclease/exonuclease/phosphatase family protein [Deltaproteobacteria bacterium]|nr:endonuclease/exonuclease/phosphatase family protein [Deltaproteobacteria bacterium]
MRLASFNVENLFGRAKVMNLATWRDGRGVLDAYARFRGLIQKARYSAADKRAMGKLLGVLGLHGTDEGPYVVLRRNRGQLVRRQGRRLEIVANGRGDWLGWLDLKEEEVSEAATRNTARVFKELEADVVAVVEAEDRVALKRFNDELIPRVGGTPYRHVMLIDGNDRRGIDVGIMCQDGYAITAMRSHVDDLADGEPVFSRDCPEYAVQLPSGETLWVLVNHLKSRGYGSAKESDAKRRRQAARVRSIYKTLKRSGANDVAVVGDFNDTPDSDALAPLLRGRELRDVSEHPRFQHDGRPGTWGNGTATGRFDYILLSSALWQKVQAAGVLRKGVWGGKNGTLWPHFPEMRRAEDAASDHAAIWVDIDL